MDALALVLEPGLHSGVAVATRINYDPHKTFADGANLPPQAGLRHDLVRACYHAVGEQFGREDGLDERNGGMLFAAQAVGLGACAP